MRPLNDWAQAEVYTGEFLQIPPGGYVCRILDAKVENGGFGEQLILKFDVIEGEYKGFFASRPAEMRTFIMTKDNATNPFFKGVITAIEESNPGYAFTATWDERTLVGKVVGVLFREEEYLNKYNNLRTATRAFACRSVKAIHDGVPVPQKRELKPEQRGRAQAASSDHERGFTEVPYDEQLPF